MPEIVPMPKLGFDMAEGTLVRAVKKIGDSVQKGDVLAEIETDKATVEIEAPVAGVVKGWLASEGQPVPVGSPMVVLGAPDEVVDLAALTGGAAAAAAPALGTGAPAAAAASPALNAGAPALVTGRVAASPVARRMAADSGADLQRIAGTGPGGRVVKRDVEAYLRGAGPAPTAAVPAAPAPASASPADQVVPLTRLRQIIARRMVESQQTVPQFYVTAEVDMQPAWDLRRQVNGLLPEGRRVSVNDFVLKATALALRQFPNLNATFAGDRLIRRGAVNIGIAVALEGGLLTVVVRDADRKPLAEIALESQAMAARAREGRVQPADIEGSTFSISNLGLPAFGEVDHFIAIVNPPEAAILAVGAVRQVPVVQSGVVVPGRRMKITCSADHRVSDGAEVAQFVQAIRQAMETPLRLLL